MVFLSLVMVMSLLKKKFNSAENKIYRFLMFFTFYLLIHEIICVITMQNRDSVPLLNEIFCRTYILGTIVFVSAFILYMLTLGTKKKENFNVDKKTLDNKIVEKQKEVKRVDTEPVTPKPVANDKIHNVIGEKKDKVEEEQSNH